MCPRMHTETGLYPAYPPDPVRRASVVQRWENLTFIHWRYPPEVVQAILPPDLEVDTFDGSAWVALVPFRMVAVRPPWAPSIPWLTTFPETNVRTYVRDAEGGTGVWFSSLDITRLAGVAVARTWFHVPYTWASMDLTVQPTSVRYRSVRRWPTKGPHVEASVTIGPPASPSPLLAFLTNRWRAYTVDGAGSVAYGPVAHEPWSIHYATLDELSESVVAAAGLEAPAGDPLVHFSRGVSARVGRLRSVGSPRRRTAATPPSTTTRNPGW